MVVGNIIKSKGVLAIGAQLKGSELRKMLSIFVSLYREDLKKVDFTLRSQSSMIESARHHFTQSPQLPVM